jgi:DNA-binding NtrC family response regulator
VGINVISRIWVREARGTLDTGLGKKRGCCLITEPFSPKKVQIQDLAVARVFVVDDEPEIASTLATILRTHGFKVRFFLSPLEALEASRTGELDLLISDVAMPGSSGIELAIKIKEIRPQCKVLLFSGQAQTADLLKKARDEGYDFQLLTKPVHPTTLLARIRDLKPGKSAFTDRDSPS